MGKPLILRRIGGDLDALFSSERLEWGSLRIVRATNDGFASMDSGREWRLDGAGKS